MKQQSTSPGEATPSPTIVQPSSNSSIDSATLALLARWRAEDAEKELAEFKKAMNDTRAGSGEPLLYP